MNSAFEMTYTGFNDVIKKFDNISKINTSDILLKSLAKIGIEVEARAKEILNEKIYNTPEGDYLRTGLLKARTISDKNATIVNDGAGITIRSSQYYAIYIELGTSKMKPRAFLLPAAQQKSDRALQILNDAVKEFLHKQ